MYRTYKYRLITNKQTKSDLENLLEDQRFLYNSALEHRRTLWKKYGKSTNYQSQCKELTNLRRSDESYRDVPANLQRGTLKRVDNSYQSFFRRVKKGEKPGYPRFKGKGWFDTLEFAEFSGITLKGNRLKSKAFGSLRVHFHRDMPEGKIKTAKLVRNIKGWYVCFSIEVPTPKKREIKTMVGGDPGLRNLMTLSTGEEIPSLKAARKAERKLKLAQQKVSRCKKRSNGRRKARQNLQRANLKVKNQRQTYAHQVSAKIIREFDLIAVEDTKIKQMMESNKVKRRKGLNRTTADASIATLIFYLSYKAENAGKTFIRVAAPYTTQDCSGCGRREKKELGEEMHNCLNCGLSLSRDHNAAINVLNKAVVSLGLFL